MKTLQTYLTRYETPVGLAAELLKKDQERRVLHEMLTAAQIPAESKSGEAICLIGRLAVLIEKKGVL